VLATPLTVCLAVAGKYLPGLSFLDLLMGDKPTIAAGDRLYQRLLSLNEEEVTEMIEGQVREQSMLSAFDDAVLPALRSMEADYRAGVLSEVARTDACHILRQAIADLAAPRTESEAGTATTAPTASILCIPASHEGDEIAALMLARVLAESGVASTVFSSQLLASECVEKAAELAPSIVCISSLPPVSTIAARALCKRLRARLPSARIVVGLWQPEGSEFTARRERLGKAGADETFPSLHRAAASLIEFAACTLPPGTDTPENVVPTPKAA
jgi:methylmalonyl-CoA mutase cobalamin-binding subunit